MRVTTLHAEAALHAPFEQSTGYRQKQDYPATRLEIFTASKRVVAVCFELESGAHIG